MVTPSQIGPLSLFEAMCAWGDPAAVAEMTCLAKEGYDSGGIVWLGQPGIDRDREYQLRYRELRSRLETALVGRLRDGSLFAVGYDSRSATDAPPVAIPADRWRVLVPNFEDSSAVGGGVGINGIQVSNVSDTHAPRLTSTPEPRPRLEISARRARFDGVDLKLTPRSFDLLAILAKEAVKRATPVDKRDLEDQLLSGTIPEKAIGQAIYKLKREMMKSGLLPEAAQSLIENVRAVGYRLKLSKSDVLMLDQGESP